WHSCEGRPFGQCCEGFAKKGCDLGWTLRYVFNDVTFDMSYTGSAMRGEIPRLERRRLWRDEDKIEIVTSAGVGGATVTQVAQRHEVTRQQIYAWPHDLKKKGLWPADAGALFFPLDIPAPAGVPVPQRPVTEVPPATATELRLQGGRSLHFDSAMYPAAPTTMICAVEAA
ncbi:MAG: transposase, partial [Rhodobacterales bacterium]|nr:transposase [Rhodobacterales bacterium]